MQISNINDYHRGWLVGKFDNAIFQSKVEVGVQSYPKGAKHEKHYHAKCYEINLVVVGSCCFHIYDKNNNEKDYVVLKAGEVIVIDPYEIVQFYATEDCTLTVIKSNSDPKDKYIVK